MRLIPRWLRRCPSIEPVTKLQCMLQLDHDQHGPRHARRPMHYAHYSGSGGETVSVTWHDADEVRRILHLPEDMGIDIFPINERRQDS